MEQYFLEFAEAISPALQVLLESVLVALAAVLIAWMSAKYSEARAGMNTDQQYLLDLLASMAVDAADQIYTDNKEKKAYAIHVVQTSLEKYGMKLDLLTIVAAIESQVRNKKLRNQEG
jgi:heme A synthase